MKKLGLLGGMSWESTQDYYRLINEGVKKELGGLHSAELLLYSVDFDPLERMLKAEDWTGLKETLKRAALTLEQGGARALVICTNTMHNCAPEIEEALEIPLLHIADATAEALKRDGIGKVGLLGTAFTMEKEFYKGRLTERHGLEVLVPEEEERRLVHRVIFEELCLGITKEESAAAYARIIEGLKRRGAEAVILGCTEIGMLLKEKVSDLPLYDTTKLHAARAVAFALAR
jgi:aspartate racemase